MVDKTKNLRTEDLEPYNLSSKNLEPYNLSSKNLEPYNLSSKNLEPYKLSSKNLEYSSLNSNTKNLEHNNPDHDTEDSEHNNQEKKMFRVESQPKLHYQFDNEIDNLKMYMRVNISMQIFTFTLMFIVYLILIRNLLGK